jgi:hypothetical protein
LNRIKFIQKILIFIIMNFLKKENKNNIKLLLYASINLLKIKNILKSFKNIYEKIKNVIKTGSKIFLA